jgi:hypothetical protein
MCIAMMSATTFRASWSICVAAALLAAGPLVHIAKTENILGGALAAGSLDPAASEAAFQHLRALQEIASASGGNRAAGTLGYDRSAEYVAERLRGGAGYVVRFEEFEFPFFEERAPPALLVRRPDGRQEPAPAAAVRTLAKRQQMSLYINLDMVGSPNFVRFLLASAATGDGLAAIARRELLTDFREHNLAVEERPGGRYVSDDASFSQKGIPTVSLYTGASGPKSEAQAGLFGGVAGRPYDLCYHQGL